MPRLLVIPGRAACIGTNISVNTPRLLGGQIVGWVTETGTFQFQIAERDREIVKSEWQTPIRWSVGV